MTVLSCQYLRYRPSYGAMALFSHCQDPLLKIALRHFLGLERAIGDGGYQRETTFAAARHDARLPLEVDERSEVTGYVV